MKEQNEHSEVFEMTGTCGSLNRGLLSGIKSVTIFSIVELKNGFINYEGSEIHSTHNLRCMSQTYSLQSWNFS